MAMFIRPILRVVVRSGENGARVVRDSIMDEPNVKVLNDSGTLLQHTTVAGNEELVSGWAKETGMKGWRGRAAGMS